MRHFIETIFFKRNDEPYTLNLDGKNLIISGDNGSGKTRLIENIYEFIEKSINSHDPYTKEQLQKELNSSQENLKYSNRGDGNYSYLNEEIERLKEKLKEFESFDITFNDVVDFRVAAKKKKSIIRLFPAIREAKIKNDGKISSLDLLLTEYGNAQRNNSKIDAGMYFE
ncbi:recombination protein RecF, partial [Escherichia coli]